MYLFLNKTGYSIVVVRMAGGHVVGVRFSIPRLCYAEALAKANVNIYENQRWYDKQREDRGRGQGL